MAHGSWQLFYVPISMWILKRYPLSNQPPAISYSIRIEVETQYFAFLPAGNFQKLFIRKERHLYLKLGDK
jgi:hypothetical protein